MMGKKIGLLGFGILFGFTLSRVGASEFDLIFNMFTGANLKLVGVILMAIIVGLVGMQLLKKQNITTRSGQPIKISHKKLGRWSLLGAALFGIGWGMAGACPGTVLAQLGEGKIFSFFTFGGMIYGTYIYARLRQNNEEL